MIKTNEGFQKTLSKNGFPSEYFLKLFNKNMSQPWTSKLSSYTIRNKIKHEGDVAKISPHYGQKWNFECLGSRYSLGWNISFK